MRAIDADALIEQTDDKYTFGDISRYEHDSIVNALNFAPTIEPERKTGKWITVDYFGEGKLAYREWECSACGCVVEDEKPTWNFCPNCGARMLRGDSNDRQM